MSKQCLAGLTGRESQIAVFTGSLFKRTPRDPARNRFLGPSTADKLSRRHEFACVEVCNSFQDLRPILLEPLLPTAQGKELPTIIRTPAHAACRCASHALSLTGRRKWLSDSAPTAVDQAEISSKATISRDKSPELNRKRLTERMTSPTRIRSPHIHTTRTNKSRRQ